MQKELNLDCEQTYDYSGMPEYNNSKQPDPEITATFKFRSQEDYNTFHSLVKEHIYNGKKVFDGMQKKESKTTWFPLKEKASNYRYKSENPKNPRFPIYIVSKGRWERRVVQERVVQVSGTGRWDRREVQERVIQVGGTGGWYR